MDAYCRAWTERDSQAAAQLFTDDAEYQPGPFAQKLRGNVMIREAWAESLESRSELELGYEVLAATARGGLVRWWATAERHGQDVRERDEGIFRLAFDEDGRCSSLEQWWNTRDEPLDGASDSP